MYTKGDWRIDQVAGGYNIWLHLCPEKDPLKWDRIARVGGEMSKTKEVKEAAEANARLIAAAPALLEACEIGLAYLKAVKTGVPRPIADLEDDIQLIKAAISLAEKS